MSEIGQKGAMKALACMPEDMIPLCAEESVAVQDLAILTSPVLQSIAHASQMHQQALVRWCL